MTSYYTRTPLGHMGMGFADRFTDCAQTDLHFCRKNGLTLDDAVAACEAAPIPKWMLDPIGGRGWAAYITAVHKEAEIWRKSNNV